MNEALFYDQVGMDLTEDSESLRLTAYPDPGTGAEPWTNGYGHTGPDVTEGQVIDKDRAVEWLRADIAKAEAQVKELVEVELTQGEYDALVDFTFNCGAGNLRSSTLLRMVNTKNWLGASAQFDRWVNGGGHVLPGLVVRRNAEEAIFLDRVQS